MSLVFNIFKQVCDVCRHPSAFECMPMTPSTCRPRETARSLPDHDYVFDLDGDENDEDRPLYHPLFSVDSKSCGESSARIHKILLSCFRELDTFHQVSHISM